MSSKKYKLSSLLFILLILGIVLVGSSESFSYSRVSKNLDYYTVNKGQSFNLILEEFPLHIYHKLLLKIYIRTNKLDIVQTGHYYLKGQSWNEFLNSISNGHVQVFKLNIPAGKNLYEIEKILSDSNLLNDCYEFKCLEDNFRFIEGTLKPDTYFYHYLSPSSKILRQSQNEFIHLTSLLWTKRSPQSPIKNLSDAIILASIVEKEAGNEEEKPVIAGVFLHRLTLGMKLQADPTIIYGLLPNFNGDITKANILDKKNPYNTYQIKGLPPTPISTISQSSLEAVILGMKNDYLYFVAKGDGTHYFSKTYNEHLEAVTKYQLN